MQETLILLFIYIFAVDCLFFGINKTIKRIQSAKISSLVYFAASRLISLQNSILILWPSSLLYSCAAQEKGKKITPKNIIQRSRLKTAIFIAHICSDILIAMLNLTGTRFHFQLLPPLRLSEGKVDQQQQQQQRLLFSANQTVNSSSDPERQTDIIGTMSIKKVQYLMYTWLFFFLV